MGGPLNWIAVLQTLFRQFPDEASQSSGFSSLERALKKKFNLSRAIYLARQKDGLKTPGDKEGFALSDENKIFRRLNLTGKPFFPVSTKKEKWSGFWPVVVGGEMTSCFGLGVKLDGKALSAEEKNVMEMVSERAALLEVERRLWKRLEEANRQSTIGFMAAVMVHEIKNPLTSLSTLLQLFPQKRTDQDFMDSFEKLFSKEINRLVHLTENYLSFLKPSPEKQVEINLNNSIGHVTQLLKPLFGTKNVQLRLRPQKPIYLKGEESQIESLIMNLLLNAYKSSSDEGWIEISTRLIFRGAARSRWIELKVKDNGKGISPENLSRIFDPFFSGHEDGVGLGLAICQKVAQNHGGYIRVKSGRAKGTVFSVFFPSS
jgi:signal transduction histidine kinase